MFSCRIDVESQNQGNYIQNVIIRQGVLVSDLIDLFRDQYKISGLACNALGLKFAYCFQTAFRPMVSTYERDETKDKK